MIDVWLTESVALALVGRATEDVESVRWTGCVDAARGHVEEARPDLLDGDAFAATPQIRLGTSMLALRWYERGVIPGGVSEYPEMAGMSVKFDPDIAKLLGVGWSGKFVVGGASR